MPCSGEILVVEDDALLNELVCAYVQIAGYSATPALDGTTALRQAALRPPDLVLLDLMLPDIDGFEVCRRLKGDAETSSVPVVMLTAMDREESRQEGLASGAVAYMTKPFNPEDLLAAIKQHATGQG